jgi:hypothetical protein
MSLFAKVRGTIESLFQLGLNGPQLKTVGGAIQVRKSDDTAGAALATVKTLTFDGEFSNGSSGVAATIDWTAAQKQVITLTGNCTFAFTAPLGAGNFLLRLVQDATGGRTATWPAAVKWGGGAAPTLSTAANAVDIASFYWNGSNYYATFTPNFA